jgi:hypothetical protein
LTAEVISTAALVEEQKQLTHQLSQQLTVFDSAE